MKKLLYIERLVIAGLLLLLMALAPAQAQNVVSRGETTVLTVEQKGEDIYTWELYTDSTGNFAKVSGQCPAALADFVPSGAFTGPTVTVLWKEPGIYFFKVTAVDANGCTNNIKIGRMEVKEELTPNLPPVAMDDQFTSSGCAIYATVITNDSDPENDYLTTRLDVKPVHGNVILNPDGTFEYRGYPQYTGADSFIYALFDKKNIPGITAKVTIQIISDIDHDGLADDSDPDADGDGILNSNEGELTADIDGDGLPNYMDIDSDGDGIVDNFEAQVSAGYMAPSTLDVNNNGVDDAYDNYQFTAELKPIDTDGDLIPDFLDMDSDNDLVPDKIEGHDANMDGKPDYTAKDKDTDGDGLNDGYDTVVNDCNKLENALGSKAAMWDTDSDGLPDWRDEDDDDDKILTMFEDLNGDNDFSNDDIDFDGSPEYLDFGRECDLFIPNSFSPNGDNIHEFYQIYCINHYPNARLYIFDQLGNKIYDKIHYGNLEFWGNYESAWWSGKPDNGTSSARNEKVAPGTYYYVLDLGNGEVKKSFVFVSY